jgi:hypothetical protein
LAGAGPSAARGQPRPGCSRTAPCCAAPRDQLIEHSYILATVIAILRAGWDENLGTVTSALRQFPELAAQAQRILDMPAAAIEANLAGQPAGVRERARRFIGAAVEGQFDAGAGGCGS